MYNNKDLVYLKDTDLSFGVDKLKLHTTDFEVQSTKEWNIVPNRKKAGLDIAEETILFGCKGQQVTGEKAYINTEQYNATIQNGRLYVEFNPSKYFNPVTLTSDTNKIAEVISNINTDLKENHKLNADLFNSSIGRLDLTAQANMLHLTPDYKDIISNGKRSQKFKQAEYPNGFLIGNKQRQVCSYDKGMKTQIDNHFKNPQSTNLMRLETRNLNSSSIQSHTEFKYISHLLNGTQVQMHRSYSKTINQVLAIGQTELTFYELNTLTDLVKNTILKTDKRGEWFKLVLLTIGDNLPNPNDFSEVIKRIYEQDIISRPQYFKISREYKELKHKSDFMKTNYLKEQSNNYANRFNEFSDKLILPYQIAE
jgi:hypothetical protein